MPGLVIHSHRPFGDFIDVTQDDEDAFSKNADVENDVEESDSSGFVTADCLATACQQHFHRLATCWIVQLQLKVGFLIACRGCSCSCFGKNIHLTAMCWDCF